MKQSINIELTPKLEVLVTGEYSKYDPEVGFSSDFEIESVDIVKGTIMDLLEYSFKRDIIAVLEEKIIDKIEN